VLVITIFLHTVLCHNKLTKMSCVGSDGLTVSIFAAHELDRPFLNRKAVLFATGTELFQIEIKDVDMRCESGHGQLVVFDQGFKAAGLAPAKLGIVQYE
jgi:hypothetical protein